MIWLPFRAAGLLVSRPKLLALGFLPGALTFLLAAATVYGLWVWALSTVTPWISLPAMMCAFVLAWLLFGNLSLLPVEDRIIEETQRAMLGEVRYQPPPFRLGRIGRELSYSALLAMGGLALFFLSLVPLFTPFTFLLAAWLTAYGFSASLYQRLEPSFRGRIRLFFRRPIDQFFLGLCLNLLLFVPVLNVFLLGYAQVLATIVFLRQRENLRTDQT